MSFRVVVEFAGGEDIAFFSGAQGQEPVDSL